MRFGAFVFLLAVLISPPAHADVLVARTFEGTVVRMDELTGEVLPGGAINATQLGGLLSGVTVKYEEGSSADGVVYVSSGFTGSILQFDLRTGNPINGGFFAQLPDNPPLEPGGDPETASPGNIKIGPDGWIWVADNTGSRVHRFDPETGLPQQQAPVDGLSGVGGIGFTTDGELISTSFVRFGANAVYKGLGDPPNVLVDSSSSTLLGPNGILVNDDNSFYVADLFSNRIALFTSAGELFQGFEIQIPFPADVDPQGQLPPGSSGPINFGADLVRMPGGDILVSTLGISSVYQGASKNYGELLRYDVFGNLVERLAVDQSPMGALTLVEGLVDLPGDYDRDGTVDQLDYALWRTFYGRSVTPYSNADGNGDGIIGLEDYTVWRDNAGAVLDAVQALAAPEPASAVLCALLILGRIRGRCRV